MTFSVDDFRANGLIFGGARPSLFSIYVPGFPAGRQGQNTVISRKLYFTAKAASLPPSNMDAIDIPYMSRSIKVNGDRTFGDWAITVMNDEDFSVRAALEEWHEAINSKEPNRQFAGGGGLVSSYKRNITVQQYGKTGIGEIVPGDVNFGQDARPIRVYELVGAFPTSIDAIGLDWGAKNEIETFDVNFAYDYWRLVGPVFGGGNVDYIDPTVFQT